MFKFENKIQLMKKYSIQDYKDNLTWAAKPDIFSKAKELRKSMTVAEEILWKHLRNNKLNGLKFRRQHPLDIFIADFYCHNKRLIIELDGGIHDTPEQKEYDEGRTFELEEKGFKILRFKNEEVINNIENVLFRIKSHS
jgi:very-short-patch-repair endonuclease